MAGKKHMWRWVVSEDLRASEPFRMVKASKGWLDDFCVFTCSILPMLHFTK